MEYNAEINTYLALILFCNHKTTSDRLLTNSFQAVNKYSWTSAKICGAPVTISFTIRRKPSAIASKKSGDKL